MSAGLIHPTAIVDPGAQLGPGVRVGAYSIIGAHVEIGERTEIGPHTVIEGPTRIGRENRIGSFTALGGAPQDKSYAGDPTRLEIGDRNTIREYCTFNRGTLKDAGVTRVGNDNWIMGYVHLAHDCRIGDSAVLANSTQLAGHVHIGDWAILGGFTGVHQFVRIGAHAMIGGGTMLRQDVPPYVTVAGNPPKAFGVNAEGLRRRAFTAEAIEAIQAAYRTLYRGGISFTDAQAELARTAAGRPELVLFAEFLKSATRGIVR
jgi:UDP-N-acetylglucosamine acyltransferase